MGLMSRVLGWGYQYAKESSTYMAARYGPSQRVKEREAGSVSRFQLVNRDDDILWIVLLFKLISLPLFNFKIQLTV